MTNSNAVTVLERANPVSIEDCSMPESAQERMIERIVGDAATPKRKPRWKRPTFTIPVVAVLTAGAFLFASALAGDRKVPVNVSDALQDPDAVERYLAGEGIDAEVLVVPIAKSEPFLVGKWFHVFFGPGVEIDPDDWALLQSHVGLIDARYESVLDRCPLGDCARTALLEIPGNVKGPITLVAGRPAHPGEEYWGEQIEQINELAPTGAFYCQRLEEMSPDEARVVLESLGYEVLMNVDVDNDTRLVDSAPRGTEVVTVFFQDPDTVDLRIAPKEGTDGSPGADHQRAMLGTPSEEHPRTSAPWARSC